MQAEHRHDKPDNYNMTGHRCRQNTDTINQTTIT